MSETVELDGDGDGVGDRSDLCPNTLANTKVDSSGCTFEAEGAEPEDVVVFAVCSGVLVVFFFLLMLSSRRRK